MTKRCSTCAINFPSNATRCAACEGPVSLITNADPHADWEERVASAKLDPVEYVIQEAPLEPKIRQWREDQLKDAGFDGLHASILAPLKRIDLHVACDLVRRSGSDLAFAILH